MGIAGIINSTQNIGVKTSKLRNFQDSSHSCIERALHSKTMMAAKLLVALGILMTEVEGNPRSPGRMGQKGKWVSVEHCMKECFALWNGIYAASGVNAQNMVTQQGIYRDCVKQCAYGKAMY